MRHTAFFTLVVLFVFLPLSAFCQTAPDEDQAVLTQLRTHLYGLASEAIDTVDDVWVEGSYFSISTEREFMFALPGVQSAPMPTVLLWSFHDRILGTKTLSLNLDQTRASLAVLIVLTRYVKFCSDLDGVCSSFSCELPCGVNLFATAAPSTRAPDTPGFLVTLSFSGRDLPGVGPIAVTIGGSSLDRLVNKTLPKAIASLEYMQTIPAPTLDTICPQLPERDPLSGEALLRAGGDLSEQDMDEEEQ